ncbi:FtsW/RodA/SpoVE family cell cycle protein [Oscillospiraceae bacterium HV4-5-C5C]|nr:FtsW/RodA/SpoVE family cell cycle protein [Oscillospiraceae bacterium HV4-5-C5C]
MEKLGLEQQRRKSLFQVLDYWLLIPVFALCIEGLYVLNTVLELQYPGQYPRNILTQAISILLGLIALAVLSLIEQSFIYPIGVFLYGLSLLMQALLPVFGSAELAAKTGSNAWLILPGIGSFQPSELSKIGLCMAVAYVLERMKLKKYSFKKGVLYLLLLLLPQLGLILIYEDDLGTGMVVVFMLAVMIFIWGIKLRYVLLILSAGVISVPLLWNFALKPYQQTRILSFLYPNYDTDATYNVTQAKAAIAAGGLSGNRSGDYVHVPVQESDFIFSAVGEYMGLVGTSLLILLAAVFIFRAFYLASKLQRPAFKYMAAGIAAVFTFHYVENICMNLGLMPVTGIPLPFVSQGGTAMLVNFLSLGILMNLSVNRNLELTMER